MATWNESAELWIEICCVCGTRWGFDDVMHEIAQQRGENILFCCPHGHWQCYLETAKPKQTDKREAIGSVITLLREPPK